jgi:subtilase family serine protease
VTVLAQGLLAALPGALAAPTPLALAQRVAYFEDFSSGTLDPERWSLPAAWALENTRMKPWEFPAMPLNDTQTPHLSDSPFGGAGRYAGSNRSTVETNWIDLTTASATAQLTLFHRYDIDPAEDAGIVLARSELRGWTVVAPNTGYPTLNGFAGSSLVFTGSTFDLSAFVGSRVKVAFEIVSGSNGITGDGWQLQSLQVAYQTTEALPDFEATGLEMFDDGGLVIFSGTAGQSVRLEVHVTNSGTAPPPRLVPVVFYDGEPGEGRLLGRADLLPVAPGASGATSLWTLLQPGAHTLTAVVDPAGGTDELSRSNNEARFSTTMEPASGVDLVPLELRVEAGGAPTTGARPGDGLVANITVTNLGSAGMQTPFGVGLYLRESGNTTVLLQETTLTIGMAAGQTTTVPLGFNAVAGDLRLLARVDTTAAVDEVSEANNEIERPFPVSTDPGVDLVLSDTRILRGGAPSSDGVEGEVLQVATTVENAGTNDLTEPFMVAAYLGDPDVGGTLVYSRRVTGGLLANQSVDVVGSWVALLGVRVLYVYADTGREIFESDELNNEDQDTVSVRADTRVNLAVTAVDFTVLGTSVNQTQVGAPVNITVTVSNLGVETAVDGFLSLSPENPWVHPGTTPLQTRRLPLTIPRAGQAQVTFPWVAEAGTHVFYFVADYALTVSETDEFDNIAVRTIDVTSDAPDLSVGSVSVRAGGGAEISALYPRLNVTIGCEVTNAGVRSVDTAFDVEVWAGQPGELGSVRLYRETVDPPFVVGDSRPVSVVWEAGFASGGSHTILVVADPAGAVIEADRSNNVAEKEVNYQASALPNLVVQSTTVSRGGTIVASAKEGDMLQVTVKVANDSPVPFTAGTVIEARDGTALIFSAPVGRLEPHQEVEFTYNWSAVAGARVRVGLNPQGDVPESDYTDNGLDVLVAVTKPAETPWLLYGGAGAAVAAGLVVALLLVMGRRRAARGEAEPPGEGAGGPAPGDAAGAPTPGDGGDGPAPGEGAGAAAPGHAPGPEGGVGPPAPPAAVEAAALPPAAGPEAPEAPAPGACPNCKEPVEPDWQLCPNCEAHLT